MKKIFLTIGAVASLTAPVAAMIACSSEKENKVVDWTTINKNAVTIKTNNDEKNNPFKDVKEDGLYLWDKTYDGKLWSGETTKDGHEVDGISRIGEAAGWALNPSVQIGKKDPNDATEKEDSFYMVYDNDDKDGLNIDNFVDTVFFEDTSTAMSDAIYDVNKNVFGNITHKAMFGKATYVKFTEDSNKKYSGSINNYMGAQNNHVSKGEGYSTSTDFMTKMEKLADEYGATHPDVLNSLLKYYGFKTKRNSDGTFDRDPNILNHASTGFAPVFYKKPIFTYEKVFDNAIKITYHDDANFQATAAHFEIAQPDGTYQAVGSWSIGHNDWSSYWGHSEAKYVGLKKD